MARIKPKKYWKAVGFFTSVIAFIAIAGGGWLCIPDFLERRRFAARTAARFSRFWLRLFGVHVEYKPSEGFLSHRCPRLIVANHVSILDIFILASLRPAVFISSVEVRNAPFLGTMTRLGGVYFTERRNTSNLTEEIREAAALLQQGFDVILFAEGTSSNGTGVLPFKSSFFEIAGMAGAEVVPVCINYQTLDGEKISGSNRDRLFYYGDMGFFGHLRELCGLRSVTVECRLLETVRSEDNPSRKVLCQSAQEAIAAHFQPVV